MRALVDVWEAYFLLKDLNICNEKIMVKPIFCE